MNPPAFFGMIVVPLAASPLVYLTGRLAGRTRATVVAQAVAVAALVERLRARGFTLVDTQWLTPFLASLGGVEISRDGPVLALAACVGTVRPKEAEGG